MQEDVYPFTEAVGGREGGRRGGGEERSVRGRRGMGGMKIKWCVVCILEKDHYVFRRQIKLNRTLKNI